MCERKMFLLRFDFNLNPHPVFRLFTFEWQLGIGREHRAKEKVKGRK